MSCNRTMTQTMRQDPLYTKMTVILLVLSSRCCCCCCNCYCCCGSCCCYCVGEDRFGFVVVSANMHTRTMDVSGYKVHMDGSNGASAMDC